MHDHNFSDRVYYVTCESDSTVLIAMDVRVQDKYIVWFDTVKERTMEISRIIEENNDKFVFERKNDSENIDIYTFVPLTLDIFNEKIKPRFPERPGFETEQEMFEAMKKSAMTA